MIELVPNTLHMSVGELTRHVSTSTGRTRNASRLINALSWAQRVSRPKCYRAGYYPPFVTIKGHIFPNGTPERARYDEYAESDVVMDALAVWVLAEAEVQSGFKPRKPTHLHEVGETILIPTLELATTLMPWDDSVNKPEVAEVCTIFDDYNSQLLRKGSL